MIATLITGCASMPQVAEYQTIEGADTIIAMQKELEKPSFQLDRVSVLRMTMNGEKLEVSSIAPTVIFATQAAGNRTVLNLATEKDKLVLFTRDGRKIKAYRTSIPVAELQPGKTFSFPVAQDPGEVVTKQFTVTQFIVQ